MILELHGSVAAPAFQKLVHRRLLTKECLVEWAAAQRPFVSVQDALTGKGTALTIDDATVTAYDTALALRSLGHQVTVYVNMYNVIVGRSYLFHLLTALVDVLYNNEIQRKKWNLNGEPEDFRARAKAELMRLPSRFAWDQWLRTLAQRYSLDYSSLKVPPEVSPISLAACHELVRAGVCLGNHCFDHVNPGARHFADFEDGVELNDACLYDHFGTAARVCAIPFGKWEPPTGQCKRMTGYTWLLADRLRPAGWVSLDVFNRVSIDSDADLSRISL
jgi:hypothetical protein